MVSNDELNMKLMAEAEYRANKNAGTAFGKVAGAVAGQNAQADCGDSCTPVQPAPTEAEQLRQRSNYLREEAMKSSKIANILERHPEFLEFLEVLRSGLV